MSRNVTIKFKLGELIDLPFLMRQVQDKIIQQSAREPGCICTHPEGPDLVYCPLGNRVGTIKAVK